MGNSIKKSVQNILLLPRKSKYKKEYLAKMNESDEEYREIVRFANDESNKTEVASKVVLINASKLRKTNVQNIDDDKFYFVHDDSFGLVRPEACRIVYEFINDNPLVRMMYGDEDYFASMKDISLEQTLFSRNTFRYRKPCFSPETFVSTDYMGNVVIKGVILKELLDDDDESMDETMFLYFLSLRAAAKIAGEDASKISRIPAILCSNPINTSEEIYFRIQKKGNAEEYLEDSFLKCPIRCTDEKYDAIRSKGRELLGLKCEAINPKVSIIIPSKDNPDYLIKCIDSLKLKGNENIEIIVVDNGSSNDNRMLIEEYLAKQNVHTKYIYEPMEFNYSKMNNMGAAKSTGDVLLLLNDDIEAGGNDFVFSMAKNAMISSNGAIGCKLLYPDKLIQHVGIVGGIDGPSHIHMGESDGDKQGFGDNRINRNVLAVTGACLAVRKELYDEIGGLNEALKVGYNDVDFCMSLAERGYCNVLLNDISLIHHESVSRGKDSADKAKAKRLIEEKAILKKAHPQFMTCDPYNGEGDDFILVFERKKDKRSNEVSLVKGQRTANDNEGWIYAGFEKAECGYDADNQETIITMKGYHVVPGIDNMRFDFSILLQKDGEMYIIDSPRMLRKDLAGRFSGTESTQLAGFNFTITTNLLKPGEYDVLLYAKDHGNVREIITGTDIKLTIG